MRGMKTIHLIRQEFPHPQKMRGMAPAGYCVGGAVVMYNNVQKPADSCLLARYPMACSLADALQSLNPSLGATHAYNYAEEIILANDKEEFSKAWSIVAEALEEES